MTAPTTCWSAMWSAQTNCKPGSSPSTLWMSRSCARLARKGLDAGGKLDLRLQDHKKLGEPRMERWPRRRRDQVAIHDCFVHCDVRVSASGDGNVRRGSGICAASPSFQYAGSGQKLRGVANGGYGLFRSCEVAHYFQDARIQPDVFDSPAAGNNQRIVVFEPNLVERGIQRKIVPAFFGVGLVSFKIVDTGGHELAGLLARADRVHRVPDHQ